MLLGSTVQFQCSMQIQEATQMLNSTNILPAEGWNTKRSNEAYKCATHVRADISPCRMIIEEVHFLIFRGFRIRDNLPAIPDYDFCMLHFFQAHCSIKVHGCDLGNYQIFTSFCVTFVDADIGFSNHIWHTYLFK